MESQPQNPEFRNNPENFQPCKTLTFGTVDVEGGVNGCLLMLNLMGPGVPGAR